jgi:3-oxoacyl-[acyl-carrier protein] reductase
VQLLKGKKALVTGGTAGIGKQIAITFAKQGASVAIFGTNRKRAELVLEELKKEATDSKQQFFAQIVDVSDKKSLELGIKELLSAWGQVEILVNNAGIARDGLLMKMKEEDWDEVIDTNLKSVYTACQVLIRPMLKARYGKIINISSIVGLTGNAGQVNYAASKSGVIGFTKALAREVANRGISVNCIAPGFIETGMTEVLNDQQRQSILKKIPMERFGKPEEVAYPALFLASDLAEYITGQVITVDGGMVM